MQNNKKHEAAAPEVPASCPGADSAVNEFNQFVKPVSLWDDAWRRLKKNKMAITGLFIVGFYFALSLFAPILPLHSYSDQTIIHQNLPPSFRQAGTVLFNVRRAEMIRQAKAEGRSTLSDKEKADLLKMHQEIKRDPVHNRHYILGTDNLGRDVFARVVYGGRISIMIGLIGTITSLFIGVLIGSVSGYFGGWIDNVLMRFVDIMYGLPYMLIVIIMMAILGQNIVILFVAIALVSWLTIARVVRGQVISLKNAEFIEAARSMGASTPRIIFKHLLPNTLGIIIIYSTLSIPGFIMNESFLSFLGLGVSAPRASWGSLVSEGVNVMTLYPWQLLVPAIAMTVFLFAMNFLGDGLRDAFDPQSKNRV
ncbi:MAG: ABC transporter permease [Treponema sp.]